MCNHFPMHRSTLVHTVFMYLCLPSKRPHIDFRTSFKNNNKPYPLLSSFNHLYKECSSALHPVVSEKVVCGTIFPCTGPHLYTVFMYLYLPSKRPHIDFHTTSFKTNIKPCPLLPSFNDLYSECSSALHPIFNEKVECETISPCTGPHL